MTDLDSLNEFLDGDAPDQADLGSVPRDEIAKHLLVAGVTRLLLRKTAASSEEVVRANMAVVLAEERAVRQRRHRILGGLAAAAAVIITTYVIFKPPPSFEPLLDRIRGFVTDGLDREYKISLEMKRSGRVPMSFQLYVRGRDRYAAGADVAFLGQQFGIWQGFDGTDHWLVVPDIANFMQQDAHTPIFVTTGSLADVWKNDELLRIRSLATGVDQLGSALGIFDLLAELKRDYKIDKSPESAATIAGGEGRIDITAYRNPQADITIPDTIRMIVEEDTGVVCAIILRFVELPSSAGYENPFRGIRYDLVQESFQADNLYEHGSYHDPDRPVERK